MFLDSHLLRDVGGHCHSNFVRTSTALNQSLLMDTGGDFIERQMQIWPDGNSFVEVVPMQRACKVENLLLTAAPSRIYGGTWKIYSLLWSYYELELGFVVAFYDGSIDMPSSCLYKWTRRACKSAAFRFSVFFVKKQKTTTITTTGTLCLTVK